MSKKHTTTTFIPYDTNKAKIERTSKRKADSTKDENPSNKKKKPTTEKETSGRRKRTVKPKITKTDRPMIEVYIGVSVDSTSGCYCIFYDKNDYVTEEYVREYKYQDTGYAYALGTLRALQSLRHSKIPVSITVANNDLCKAIYKDLLLPHDDLIEKIRSLIKNADREIYVVHCSTKKTPEKQKEAVRIANDVLYLKEDENTTANEEDVVMDLGVAEPKPTKIKEITEKVDKVDAGIEIKGGNIKEEVLNEQVTTEVTSTEDISNAIKEVVSNTDDIGKIEEAVQQAVQESLGLKHPYKVVIDTTVETTVETKVTVKVVEVPMEATEKETEVLDVSPAASSYWTGFKNIYDVLSAPFRTNKSS